MEGDTTVVVIQTVASVDSKTIGRTNEVVDAHIERENPHTHVNGAEQPDCKQNDRTKQKEDAVEDVEQPREQRSKLIDDGCDLHLPKLESSSARCRDEFGNESNIGTSIVVIPLSDCCSCSRSTHDLGTSHFEHQSASKAYPFAITGLNHAALCCENLERTLEFYCGLLGLKISPDRPDLQYRGAWLHLGEEGLHIMEVANPDPVHGRPLHGGFDRHLCFNCDNVEKLKKTFEDAGLPYQTSVIPSIFCRDPDGNGLEFVENGASHDHYDLENLVHE